MDGGDNHVNFDVGEVVKSLKQFADNAQNTEALMKQCGQIMRRYVDDKFQQEGPGWAPLSESTLRHRRHADSAKILQDTGVLAGSFDVLAGDEYAQVYTNVPYAIFHLEDSSHQPARNFFDIDLDAALTLSIRIILDGLGR